MKKNIKQIEAAQRKIKDQEILDPFGLNLNSRLINIGITTNHLHNSQINYFLFKAINDLLKDYRGFNINLFVEHLSPPMMLLMCPIFDISRITEFDMPVLTTTLESCFKLLEHGKSKIWNYVSDIQPLINNKFNFNKIINNPRITNIFRYDVYNNIAKDEFNIERDFAVIEDFNIRDLITMVIRESSNASIV